MMARMDKDLDKLKKMSAAELTRVEKKAWITINGFFNGNASQKDAKERVASWKLPIP